MSCAESRIPRSRGTSKSRLEGAAGRGEISAARTLHSSRAGFTLIEILMAAVAGALILGSIYTVFTRAVQMRNSATARTQENALRMRAVNMLRNDLQNALVSGGVLAASLDGSLQGQNSQFPGYLRFTTTTARSADAELHGDIQEVEYYIANEARATDRRSGVLVRVIHNNLLGEIEDAGTEEQLLAGVESLEVSFYDGQNWTDTWQLNPETPTVPKAVRVRIQPYADETKHRAALPIEIFALWPTEPRIASTSGTSATNPPGSSGNPPAGTPGGGNTGNPTTPPGGTPSGTP